MDKYILFTAKDGSGRWFYAAPNLDCGLTVEQIAEKDSQLYPDFSWSLILKDDLTNMMREKSSTFGYRKKEETLEMLSTLYG